MKMPQPKPVEHDNVGINTKISYRYGDGVLQGPYSVLKVWRDHEGRKAMIYRLGEQQRSILLADDEDYGTLYIFQHP